MAALVHRYVAILRGLVVRRLLVRRLLVRRLVVCRLVVRRLVVRRLVVRRLVVRKLVLCKLEVCRLVMVDNLIVLGLAQVVFSDGLGELGCNKIPPGVDGAGWSGHDLKYGTCDNQVLSVLVDIEVAVSAPRDYGACRPIGVMPRRDRDHVGIEERARVPAIS
jgi:hypothetical protein